MIKKSVETSKKKKKKKILFKNSKIHKLRRSDH